VDEENPIPQLLLYVQDRDLWKWDLPASKSINTYISSLPRTFEQWTKTARMLTEAAGLESACSQGEAMLRREATLVEDITAIAEEWEIKGHKVLATNASILRSDAAGELAKKEGYAFGACYWVKSGLVNWSLRVREGDFDVAQLAASFPGGGGHPAAAGFSVPVERVSFSERKVF
jgi:oligoribonuclease NrnB/cAMP/cGMP phosphodiesterase (DHH superfamily)